MLTNAAPEAMTEVHEKYMRLALKEASKALEENEVPIGAIVVLNDHIIAKGYNQVEKLNDSTAHAEIIALTSAFNYLGAKYLPDATLYVTIEPCLMCAGALYWSQIGAIVYGAEDIKNGYRKYVCCEKPEGKDKIHGPFHPKTTIITGVLKEECSTLIQDFFRAKR
jgi:tRNA(adenine34) deaminase